MEKTNRKKALIAYMRAIISPMRSPVNEPWAKPGKGNWREERG